MIYNIKQTDIITVAGQRGTGKSEFAKKYISDLTIPFIVFDPNAEFVTQFPSNTYVPKTEGVEEFSKFCASIWKRGNMIIVIDECEEFLQERRPLPPYAAQIVRRGRHRGIGVIAITRRPAELSKTVISLSNYVILYRFFLPNDIKYLSEFIGNTAEKLPTLPDYHFMVYSRGKTTIHKPIKMI